MKKFLIMSLVLTSFYGCLPDGNSPISSTGKFPVSMSLGNYTTASVFDFLIPSAHAVVGDLRFCFKRLRFKTDLTATLDPLLAEDNIDLALGEVLISNGGTALSQVSVPAGTYHRIEFDLEPSCAGKSVVLSNDFGTFSSASTITIRFDGTFVVDGSVNLQLGVQDILNAANAYNGVGTLKDAMEAVSGTM